MRKFSVRVHGMPGLALSNLTGEAICRMLCAFARESKMPRWVTFEAQGDGDDFSLPGSAFEDSVWAALKAMAAATGDEKAESAG